MTLASYAKSNCANWSTAGCLISHELAIQPYADLLTIKPGTCVVAAGYTCEWFRKNILAAASCPESIREAYAGRDSSVETGKPRVRICPDCGKEPLASRQRYCNACALSRRRKTNRESQIRKRRRTHYACQQLKQFSPPKKAFKRPERHKNDARKT